MLADILNPMQGMQGASEAIQRFAPDDIAVKIAISVGIGLLVGFEREWSNKDVGVRSFALTSLLGMLSALISTQLALASMITALVIVIFVNWGSLQTDRKLEITTSVALMVTVVLGALVGLGHHFTPIASAIIMTMLLAWKEELHRFAGGLRPEEIRSAVLLGLLGFVIYPALPNTFFDPWKLINPRQAWVTIVVVALVGFLNYVLLRLYSTKGLTYSAVLGGLVNSTATVSELSHLLGAQAGLAGMVTPIVLITTLAMFARNLLLLALFAPQGLLAAAAPIVLMGAVAVLFIFAQNRQKHLVEEHQAIKLGSPVSLRRVFTFGVLFVVIGVAGAVSQRLLGKFGLLLVSAIGGFVSSASSTAAAANMARNGLVDANIAGVATVITSITSAFVNLPIAFRCVQEPSVRRRMLIAFVSIAATGAAVMVAMHFFPITAALK